MQLMFFRFQLNYVLIPFSFAYQMNINAVQIEQVSLLAYQQFIFA